MNLCVVLGLALTIPNAEITIKAADFKPSKEIEKVEVFEAALVKIKGSTTLKIQLPVISGTGYRWELLGPDHGPIVFKKMSFVKPERPIPGAPTLQEFEFKANPTSEGVSLQVVLIFNLRRPFEGLGTKVYQVRIIVGDS